MTVQELTEQVQFVSFTQWMFKYTKEEGFTIFYIGFQFIPFVDHTGKYLLNEFILHL